MPDVARKPRVTAMTACGYCTFGGNHHQCPGGVRNGNGSIARCTCSETERCGSIRCTDCNNRDPETIGEDWRCIDRNDCLAEQERSAQKNPAYLRIREVREAHGMDRKIRRGTSTPGDPEKPSRAPRSAATGKPCTCGCGETTGGGRFRPGHDSKYLTKLVESAGDEARAAAYAISDAFGAKYDKRASK